MDLLYNNMCYRKITEDILELKPKEVVTYLELALKSETTVNVETLVKDLGITRRTVSSHLRKFRKNGLIKVEKNYYQLSTNHCDLVEVKKLLNLPIDNALKGFLTLLNALCEDGKTQYSVSEMAEKLTIGTRMVAKYLKKAKELGYISREDGITKLLNKDIFVVDKKRKRYEDLLCDNWAEWLERGTK